MNRVITIHLGAGSQGEFLSFGYTDSRTVYTANMLEITITTIQNLRDSMHYVKDKKNSLSHSKVTGRRIEVAVHLFPLDMFHLLTMAYPLGPAYC